MSGNETEFYGDSWLTAKPIYLTGLDMFQPATAMDRTPKRKSWRMLDYETDTLSGIMLIAGPETMAPQITFALRVSGWHAISIGAWKIKDWYLNPGDSHELLVKLSNEQTFSIIELPTLHVGGYEGTQYHPSQPLEWDRWTGGEELEERFWKVADLTNQQLVVNQISHRVASGDEPGSVQCSPATLAYIKLVPLSDSEISTWKIDLNCKNTRRLFAHNDFSYPSTEEEIRRNIEPFRNSDYSRIYYEGAMGDLRLYLNNTGKIPTYSELDDFFVRDFRIAAEDWRSWHERNIDPFQVALDYTHEVGLEFHACYRVAGFHFPPPLDHFDHGSSLYNNHPELRGVNRSGALTPRLSYSYPETRKYVISLLEEMASYDIDGICILYNRRPPLVEYEPPVVDGFKSEYGLDPRQLDQLDERWLSHRARVLTQFMREVREAMDRACEKRGRSRRIEITAIVMSSEEENLVNGMNPQAWIEEELVDTLVPYTSEPNLNHVDEAWTDVSKLDYFLSITRGTSCTLAPNIQPDALSAEGYRRRADALYKTGVDSLFFWWADVSSNVNYKNSWNALRRLGHQEEIRSWSAAGEPSLASPILTVRKLGGWDMAYLTPG